ncbi:NUDIX hydrolase domain-like protein [Crucibulum laeve]|uniref:NUDIX hydrolase domain-like protein n=1 Tax=Crucibulum laeve TaxID=68775 RepID=A0A5C3LKE9_9AGAR|nr:NUDIX hydrolase domain-like protein [Crucibulum laeve]
MSSKNAPKPMNLLKYHRPKIRLNEARIPPLSQESKRCLRNLAVYRPQKPKLILPRSKCAAVLVALFVGRQGDLYVLLSRRSANLRTYAGDTSLPGGKVDPEDRTLEDTARREAYEEIGLPRDRQKVPLLCILDPVLAAELVVTPVVVLILDNTLRPILNAAEVASLFSHPLASFLSSNLPFPQEPESVEVPYHTSFDIPSTGPENKKISFRVHQFLTGREAGGIKPVFGLTAGILIRVATIGYAREPDFEVNPRGTPTQEQRIAWALLSRPAFREACIMEGIDLSTARRIAGVSEEEDRQLGGDKGSVREKERRNEFEGRWRKLRRSKL